ncbi:hypothetical protein NQZ68_039146 [Dissostichus eleginoides]|nr:hypothetical protein NQZ68_041569 [Dissostichus eleginoides]KAI9545150.1 hypothetical protein NQZ68_039146 [Dissostichus eleginoides]
MAALKLYALDTLQSASAKCLGITSRPSFGVHSGVISSVSADVLATVVPVGSVPVPAVPGSSRSEDERSGEGQLRLCRGPSSRVTAVPEVKVAHRHLSSEAVKRWVVPSTDVFLADRIVCV